MVLFNRNVNSINLQSSYEMWDDPEVRSPIFQARYYNHQQPEFSSSEIHPVFAEKNSGSGSESGFDSWTGNEPMTSYPVGPVASARSSGRIKVLPLPIPVALPVQVSSLNPSLRRQI